MGNKHHKVDHFRLMNFSRPLLDRVICVMLFLLIVSMLDVRLVAFFRLLFFPLRVLLLRPSCDI